MRRPSNSERRLYRMLVVNHLYLMRKLFGFTLKSYFYWCWSELGLWVTVGIRLFAGGGPARLLGITDGYRELLGSMFKSRVHK